MLDINFDQFERSGQNTCLWYRQDEVRLVTECRQQYYFYIKDQEYLNFCSTCGKPIEFVTYREVVKL